MNAPLDDLPSVAQTELNPGAVEDYLPARMINEAAYCHRLFYLMHVEGHLPPAPTPRKGRMYIPESILKRMLYAPETQTTNPFR